MDELDDDDYVVVDRNSDDDDYEPMDNLPGRKPAEPKQSSPVSIDNDKKKSSLKSFAKKLQNSLSRTGRLCYVAKWKIVLNPFHDN